MDWHSYSPDYHSLWFMIHARRSPPASSRWSFQFSLRSFRWSCFCPVLFKAFGKRHGLDFLIAGFDSLLFFSIEIFEIPGAQNHQTSADLEQHIFAECEVILAVVLAWASANFVLRLCSIVTAHGWHMKKKVLNFLWHFLSIFSNSFFFISHLAVPSISKIYNFILNSAWLKIYIWFFTTASNRICKRHFCFISHYS